MSTTELTSAPVTAVVGVDAPLLAQANIPAVPAAAAAAVPAAPAGVATLSGASAGTQIIRGETRVSVEGNAALQAGDRVIVPKDGSANITFPGPGANKTPLNGVLAGGTDAVIGVKQLATGVEQVVVDVSAGDLFMAQPDDLADGASVAVRKKAAAAGGSLLGDFGLAALGIGGLAALAGGGGGGGIDTATMMPPPGSGTTGDGTPSGGTAGGTSAGLLSPTSTAVDNATNALNGGMLAGAELGTIAKPVDDAVAMVTDALNEALTPVVGDDFTPNQPNNLDPVDDLVGSVTAPLTSGVSPLVDSLLGQGATGSLVSPVTTQVDFLTDALSSGAHSLGLSPLVNGVYAVENALTPVTDLTSGLLNTLAGTTSGLLAPVTDLLSAANVGGLLAPVTSLLGSTDGSSLLAPVTGLLDGGSDAGNLLSPISGLLGGAPNAGGLLAPVTDLLGGSTDTPTVDLSNLLTPLTGALAGSGDTGSLLTPITDTLSGLTTGDTGGLLSPVTGLLSGGGGLLKPVTDMLGDATGGQSLDSSMLTSLLTPVTDTAGDLTGSLSGFTAGGSFTGNLGGALSPVTDLLTSADIGGTGSLLTPITDVLNSTTVSGSGSLETTSGIDGLLGTVDAVGSGLLSGLPIFTAPSTTTPEVPTTDLLSSLLSILGDGATTGTGSVSTTDLTSLSGGLLAPVEGLLSAAAPLSAPEASASFDGSGLLSDLGSTTDTLGLGQLTSISSVSDPLATSPVGAALSGL